MKLGKLILLLVIFGILFGIVVYMNSQRQEEQRELRVAETTKLFPDLDESNIFRITVSNMNYDTYVLRKTAGEWEVALGPNPMTTMIRQGKENEEGSEPVGLLPEEKMTSEGDPFRTYHKADEDKVQSLIETLMDLQTGHFVTSDDDQRARLGVMGSLMGTEIHVYDTDDGEIAGVVLGAPEGDFTSTYIRKVEESDIYKIDGNIYMPFQTKVGDLRARQMFDTAPEAINSVSVTDNENSRVYTLNRIDLDWNAVLEDGTTLELDPEKVDDLLSTLGSLSVTSFVNVDDEMRGPAPDGEEWDEADPFSLLSPLKTVAYTDSAGDTFTIVVGMKSGSNYYAAISDNITDVFKISAAKVDNISPDPQTLVPGEEEEADVATLPEGMTDTAEIDELPIELVPADELGGE